MKKLNKKQDDEYLMMRINQEENWIYKHFYSPKAIFLTIITFGLYSIAQHQNYMERVGLI